MAMFHAAQGHGDPPHMARQDGAHGFPRPVPKAKTQVTLPVHNVGEARDRKGQPVRDPECFGLHKSAFTLY